MKFLRHPVAALVIFAVLVSLTVSIYQGMQVKYDVQDNYTVDGVNIMDRFNNLGIITSMNQTVSSVYELRSPTASPFDILGALASAGVGVLKIIGNLLVLPLQILGIVLDYFHIPPILQAGLGVLIAIYIAFIILSAYLRSEI